MTVSVFFIDKRQFMFMWLFAFSEMHSLGMRGGVREMLGCALFCYSSQGQFMMEAFFCFFFLLVNEQRCAGSY